MAESDKPQSNTMADITNNHGIITQGQVGTNTINQLGPPPPRFEYVGELPAQKRPDGNYTRTFVIDLITAMPANNLLVTVKKTDVVQGGMVGFSVGPWDGVAMATNGAMDELFWTKLATPSSGRHTIQLLVRDPKAKPSITVAFNQ
jgi:hypothetical protein